MSPLSLLILVILSLLFSLVTLGLSVFFIFSLNQSFIDFSLLFSFFLFPVYSVVSFILLALGLVLSSISSFLKLEG